jgi:glucosamine--fructose-6-phosphate aminotransferase (isomerizing)
LALITDNTPVIYLMTKDGDEALTFSAIEEVKSRKGIPFLIGQHPKADLSIPTDNQFGFLWNNIAIQLIAYHLSVHKGINPDMPRNLAKVVTVG